MTTPETDFDKMLLHEYANMVFDDYNKRLSLAMSREHEKFKTQFAKKEKRLIEKWEEYKKEHHSDISLSEYRYDTITGSKKKL